MQYPALSGSAVAATVSSGSTHSSFKMYDPWAQDVATDGAATLTTVTQRSSIKLWLRRVQTCCGFEKKEKNKKKGISEKEATAQEDTANDCLTNPLE